jgi:hypothetical protein
MTLFKMDFSSEAVNKQEAKEKLWELHFAEYGRGVSMYRTTEISRLVLQGIPDRLRREVWMSFSGTASILPYKISYYNVLFVNFKIHPPAL